VSLPQRNGKTQLVQAVPTDLSTPRDLKSAVDRGSLSVTPRPIHSEAQQSHPSTQDIPEHKAEETAGKKRQKYDDDDPQQPQPISSTSTHNPMERPRNPSAKRQKKQGPNIFIPKSNKPNKVDLLLVPLPCSDNSIVLNRGKQLSRTINGK
jgi:hypothetical protein